RVKRPVQEGSENKRAQNPQNQEQRLGIFCLAKICGRQRQHKNSPGNAESQLNARRWRVLAKREPDCTGLRRDPQTYPPSSDKKSSKCRYNAHPKDSLTRPQKGSDRERRKHASSHKAKTHCGFY